MDVPLGRNVESHDSRPTSPDRDHHRHCAPPPAGGRKSRITTVQASQPQQTTTRVARSEAIRNGPHADERKEKKERDGCRRTNRARSPLEALVASRRGGMPCGGTDGTPVDLHVQLSRYSVMGFNPVPDRSVRIRTHRSGSGSLYPVTAYLSASADIHRRHRGIRHRPSFPSPPCRIGSMRASRSPTSRS